MEAVRPGLFTWTGEHPNWEHELTWGPEVRSYAVDLEDFRVLIDPDSCPRRAPTPVLLTCRGIGARRTSSNLPVLDEPPAGIEARAGYFAEEFAYWLPAWSAIVLGDAFMDGETPVRVDDRRPELYTATCAARSAVRARAADARRDHRPGRLRRVARHLERGAM